MSKLFIILHYYYCFVHGYTHFQRGIDFDVCNHVIFLILPMCTLASIFFFYLTVYCTTLLFFTLHLTLDTKYFLILQSIFKREKKYNSQLLLLYNKCVLYVDNGYRYYVRILYSLEHSCWQWQQHITKWHIAHRMITFGYVYTNGFASKRVRIIQARSVYARFVVVSQRNSTHLSI